jgi:hypothetical protein
VEPPEQLLSALTSILSRQCGTEALISYRRLARAGYRGEPARTSFLVEALLKAGFPDPLGRGTWKLDRVARSGHRKKFYAVLVREDGARRAGEMVSRIREYRRRLGCA